MLFRALAFVAVAVISCMLLLSHKFPALYTLARRPQHTTKLDGPVHSPLQSNPSSTKSSPPTPVDPASLHQPIVNGIPSEIAADEIAFLQQAQTTPPHLFDLSSYAARITSFARLLEAWNSDTSTDRSQGQKLFVEHFSWWLPPSVAYNPFFEPPPSSDPNLPPEPSTTGVVICAGNDNIDVAVHTLLSLRAQLGTLNVEIAYAGGQDLSPENQQMLLDLDRGAKLVNLFESFDQSVAGLTNGTWGLKSFAALNSRYSKVVVLDADVIFFSNPEEYFDTHPRLKETGTLFFHDRAIKEKGASKWVQELLSGREPSFELDQSLFWQDKLCSQQDPGVVFIDKTKPSAFMSLVFTTYLNTWEGITRLGKTKYPGDKESFWLAAELSSAPYAFSPEYAGLIGYEDNVRLPHSVAEHKICGRHPLHLGLDGKPLWFSSGLRANNRKDENNKPNREFAKFTHWVKPGFTRDQQPKWTSMEESLLCVEFNELVEEIPPVVNGHLINARARAEGADDITLGPVETKS